jgi:predicted nucleotidyltransferase
MRRDEALEILKQRQAEIKAFGVKSLALFGSVARDEANPDSDVDLLVEFSVPVGLFQVVRLKEYLEEALGHSVDLVTPDALREQIRSQVLREAMRAA